MAVLPSSRPSHPRSSTLWVTIAVVVLTLARSLVFLVWQQSFFDSDQAVLGLMAKHMAEGRAFPVFIYGQNYMLGVEAWLAAPLFLIAGPSVQALRLPVVAINVAIALLLVRVLERDAGLRPALAGVAAVFFILPPPGTASLFLAASGGTVEPLLYVLLLWVLRRKPVWFGLVLGFGFVHREFTIYGFLALLVLAAAHRRLFTRDALKQLLVVAGMAAAVWVVIQVAFAYSSAMGPGTTREGLPHAGNNVGQLAQRICLDWRAVPIGLWRIVTFHWPLLFGTRVMPVRAFDVETDVVQGLRGVGWVLAAAMVLALARVIWRLVREREWHRQYDICAYLVLVGLLSASAYTVARCGVIDLPRMRYDMLSVLGASGLAAWFLATERSRAWIATWIVLVGMWAVVGVVANGRVLAQYLRDPPAGGKEQILEALDARGIHYAIGKYRDAYVIAFLSNERIVMSSLNRVRITRYEREVAAHKAEAVRIARTPCRGGAEVLPGVYFCPP